MLCESVTCPYSLRKAVAKREAKNAKLRQKRRAAKAAKEGQAKKAKNDDDSLKRFKAAVANSDAPAPHPKPGFKRVKYPDGRTADIPDAEATPQGTMVQFVMPGGLWGWNRLSHPDDSDYESPEEPDFCEHDIESGKFCVDCTVNSKYLAEQPHSSCDNSDDE
jgi:hypothetical protein